MVEKLCTGRMPLLCGCMGRGISCHESRGEIGQPICATPSAIGQSLVHNVANQWGCEKTCHLIFVFPSSSRMHIGFFLVNCFYVPFYSVTFFLLFLGCLFPTPALLHSCSALPLSPRWLSLPSTSSKAQRYEITIMSKRNFFLYTPLLPTCTMGSIEELLS